LRSWRVAATGFSFAIFGLGGVFLTVTVFPALALVDPERCPARSRWLIQKTFQLYILMLKFLNLIDVEVEGFERLKSGNGRLIIANHPTLLDVVLLLSLLPNVQCVVKRGLWQNPFLRGVVAAAGYIPNDLPAADLCDRASASLVQGCNLLIFPEGTRTRPDRELKFYRGFANIAAATGAEIQSVLITCRPLTLTKGEPWYRVPDRTPTFHVAVRAQWCWDSFTQHPHRSRNVRHLVTSVESYYKKALLHESGT